MGASKEEKKVAVICGDVAAAFYVACEKALRGRSACSQVDLPTSRVQKFSSTSAKRELEIFNVLREADTFYYHRQPSCIVCQQHGQRAIGTIVD